MVVDLAELPWAWILGTAIPAVLAGFAAAKRVNTEKQRVDNERRAATAKASDAFRDDLIHRVDRLQGECDALRRENVELSGVVAHLRAEMTILEAKFSTRIALYESAQQVMPFAMWFKDDNGVMRELNPEYERLILRPLGKSKDDYIGRTDEEFWGHAMNMPEIASAYTAHDQQVIMKGEAWSGLEMVATHIDGSNVPWWICKWPRKQSGYTTGICGVAIPCDVINQNSEGCCVQLRADQSTSFDDTPP